MANFCLPAECSRIRRGQTRRRTHGARAGESGAGDGGLTMSGGLPTSSQVRPQYHHNLCKTTNDPKAVTILRRLWGQFVVVTPPTPAKATIHRCEVQLKFKRKTKMVKRVSNVVIQISLLTLENGARCAQRPRPRQLEGACGKEMKHGKLIKGEQSSILP